MKIVTSLLKGFVPLVVVLVIWQLVGDKSSITLPPPSTWWDALKSIEQQGALWGPFGKTLLLFFEGMVLSTILGVALGLALGSSDLFSRGSGPFLEYWRFTPAVAIVPAVDLVFGINHGAEVGVVVFGTIWPIMLNVTAGRRALPELRMDLAATLHLSWWTRMRKIVIPSLVPEIMTGLRVAGPICLIVTLLADYLFSTGGLGFAIVRYQGEFDAADTFAIAALIGVVGYLVTLGLSLTESVALRPWNMNGDAS